MGGKLKVIIGGAFFAGIVGFVGLILSGVQIGQTKQGSIEDDAMNQTRIYLQEASIALQEQDHEIQVQMLTLQATNYRNDEVATQTALELVLLKGTEVALNNQIENIQKALTAMAPSSTPTPTATSTKEPLKPTHTPSPTETATIAVIIEDGEVSTPTDVPSPTPEIIKHIVEAGDTLFLIADKYDRSIGELIVANNIFNANHIEIGQALLIPSEKLSYPPPVISINTNAVVVKSKPDVNSETIHWLKRGDTALIVAGVGGWYYGCFGNGEGWLSVSQTRPVDLERLDYSAYGGYCP